jgi:hypothetical protein
MSLAWARTTPALRQAPADRRRARAMGFTERRGTRRGEA